MKTSQIAVSPLGTVKLMVPGQSPIVLQIMPGGGQNGVTLLGMQLPKGVTAKCRLPRKRHLTNA